MVQYNTDRAFGGNPRISSYDYYLRGEYGDILYAEAAKMEETTNTVAEATTTLKISVHLK